MKVYKKDEVDNTFSNWQSDLGQLDVIEVYTKSDIVAMLTEIQLEIEEKDKETTLDDYDCGYNTGIYVSSEIIQQKIDKLKETKDGENNY